MRTIQVRLLLLAGILGFSKSQISLDGQPRVYTLFEGTQDIYKFDDTPGALTCMDGTGTTLGQGTYKVNFISVDPTTNCVSCFNVWADGGQDYFLRYVPGVQKLDYDVANLYTITVSCEDKNGAGAEETVEVRITPNNPPVFGAVPFNPVQVTALDLGGGTSIYEVKASDTEGDDLEYQLETNPTSSNFAIRKSGQNGEIYTVNGFQGVCSGQSIYEFVVRVKDAYHEFSDPVSINLQINYPNIPSIGNANQEVVIEENIVKNIHQFSGVSGIISIDSVQPSIMRNKVTLFGGNILKVDEVFDFEEFNSANVTLLVKNGECSAKYWLKIRVSEQNDLPVLTPAAVSAFVPEGVITYNPAFVVADQDFGDTKTYTIERAISGTRDLTRDFQIDKDGVITSNYEFDLDGRGAETETILFTVRATDSRGGYDESDVQLIVENINDNAPVITNSALKITDIMDCSPVQEIATISAVDDDTGVNGQYVFKGSGAGILSVNADGSVFLTSQVTAGTIYTLNVFAEDLGNPPLTSIKPVTITVIGQPCTTLPPPVTVAVTVNPNNNNNNSNNNNNNNGNSNAATNAVTSATVIKSTSLLDDPTNLIWMILLGLLGLLLLGLLAWLLWKFCFPRCCPGFCRSDGVMGRNTENRGFCQRCCGRSEPTVGPTEPEHYPEGKVKDFWQEHYQEMDYNDTTHRSRVPQSGFHEDGYLNPR